MGSVGHAEPRAVVGRLVESRSGAGGGWRLARDPAGIDLAEVWNALNGDDPILGLHAPEALCPVGQCIPPLLVDIDRRVNVALTTELGTVTVAAVAAGVRA